MRWVNNLLTLGLVAVGLMASGFLVDYSLTSTEYRFGSEVAGWRYNSPHHYVASATFELMLAITGLLAGTWLSPMTKCVAAKAAILLVIALTAW
jgi:hypothetical protein